MNKAVGLFVVGFLISAVGYAADVEISETIQGKIAASEGQAGVNYKARCEAWEKAAKTDGGESVLYTNCGAENAVAFKTQTVGEECGDYVYPGGNVVYTCYPKYTDNKAFGYAAKSEAKLLLTLSGDEYFPSGCQVVAHNVCNRVRLACPRRSLHSRAA